MQFSSYSGAQLELVKFDAKVQLQVQFDAPKRMLLAWKIANLENIMKNMSLI